MNVLVGVMEAPGTLPLIKKLQRGVDGLPSTLHRVYETCLAPTLGLPLGKWMDTNRRVMYEDLHGGSKGQVGFGVYNMPL